MGYKYVVLRMNNNRLTDSCSNCGDELYPNKVNKLWTLWECKTCMDYGMTKAMYQKTDVTRPVGLGIEKDSPDDIIVYHGDVFDSEWTSESYKLYQKHRENPTGELLSRVID